MNVQAPECNTSLPQAEPCKMALPALFYRMLPMSLENVPTFLRLVAARPV
jgi:hypothetical protein